MTEQTRENKKAAYELCLQQLSGLLVRGKTSYIDC